MEGLARVGLWLAALVIVAGVVGAVTCGAPVREGVMRVTPGVLDPAACVEGTAACIATDAGMVPAQCDNTHRMWSTLRAAQTARDAPASRSASCAIESDAGRPPAASADGGVR